MIKIYGRERCDWCRRAVKLAEDYNLDYEYLDIYEQGKRDEFLRQGLKTVPQIWWGEQHVGGYMEFTQLIEETIGGYGEGKL